MKLHIISYGIKHGNLKEDVNLYYDVRTLKNPYWNKDLKYYTGLDKEIKEYIFSDSESMTLFNNIISNIEFNLPRWKKADTYTLAVSCTGGQHRSVALVEKIEEYFKDRYIVTKHHRDIDKAQTKPENKLHQDPKYIPKVVCIGGGSGMSTLMSGLKQFPLKLSAIVTVGDNGGSTGILREEFNVPALGDIRKNILSLTSDNTIYNDLFNYRFDKVEGLKGHVLGNLVLAALHEINDYDFIKSINDFSLLTNIDGKVIPVSNDLVHIGCEYTDNTKSEGEVNIPSDKQIKSVFRTDNSRVNNAAVNEIRDADIVVISPGSLYTSIIPNFLYDEIVEALNQTYAKKILVSNLTTQKGETDNYTLKNHIDAITDIIGKNNIDLVIANNNYDIDKDILKRYEKEGSYLIDESDYTGETILDDLITVKDKNIRHNSRRIAYHIFNYTFSFVSRNKL